MNSTPQIAGYQLDQQLLKHPLAELWHGRNFTGMEVVALVLSEAGSRDAVVRDRLVQAGRGAALEPGQQETPLWAANFSADRPYAITQLIPGQSGAERLLDPLDGIIGNDDHALQTIRARLSQYGAVPPSMPSYVDENGAPIVPAEDETGAPADPSNDDQRDFPSYTGDAPTAQPEQKPSKLAVAREYRQKIGAWAYLVVALIVLFTFSVTYSIGSGIASAVKDEPAEAAPPAAVSPSPLPSPVLLPGIERITTAPYKEPTGGPGLIGATYKPGGDFQVVEGAGLPFAFGWPRPPAPSSLGESSTAVYRRVQTDVEPGLSHGTLEARIALHPCKSLAACLADRTAFDAEWTKVLKAPAPKTAKGDRTWLTARTTKPYTLSMTRAYQSAGQWWLVGVAVIAGDGEQPEAQRILNDIWHQTS
ncbi:hypothetical protein EV646_105434 [Kribbella antiqua]|uniref:Uncharacterized protein n=1 Tax=Kribbella antiqua TaxID=2512217 RepID=A0A4R2IY80_9ACTN|nr:hypothetical protein [Kribbella antiqua]TCO47875.1 hypothetical protein EV646_105434 [Kribbella antiqua]